MKSRLSFIFSLIAAAIMGFSSIGTAWATSFNQNDIIDDGVFDNVATMNITQIDGFLNQFPSSCISTDHGFSAADPTGYSPSTGFTYSGSVSAGQVIYDAGRAYGLNPQVLLATLQKEQSLVGGGAGCSILAYTGAMGYGCPDSGTTHNYPAEGALVTPLYYINGNPVTSVSGTCVNSVSKAGFSEQVIHAAWLFKFGEQRSKGNIGWDVQATNSPELGDHWDNSDDPQSCYGGPMTQGTLQRCPGGGNTYYDGYTTIDGNAVHMDTGGTAALYWYTPHFPGNQNFFNLFTGWFGSTSGTGPNISWNFETLDGSTQSISSIAGQVGNYPYTLTIGSSLHVFYYDIGNGDLRHAWTDANGWHFEVIDGSGGTGGQITANVGGMPKALVYNNQLYVIYHNFQDNTLRLATQSGSNWTAQTLDGAGGPGGQVNGNVGLDITTLTNGSSLHVFYSDATQGNLRHAWYDSSSWHFETLDGAPGTIAGKNGNIGQGVTAQFIGNSVHVFYYDGTAGVLRHGWTDANGWHFEDLDGSGNSVSRYMSDLGYSPEFVWWQGSIHLYYHDITHGVLRHGWTDANGWHFEDLDGSGNSVSRYTSNVGLRTSIAIDNNTMNVFYYDAPSHSVRQAWFNATGWHFIDIDGTANNVAGSSSQLGEFVSAALFGSAVQVFYFDATHSTLKHAWGPQYF